MKIYRHGDIIFRVVNKLPKGEVKELGNTFEQHGETGKMHTVEGVRVIEIGVPRARVGTQVIDVDWRKFIVTPKTPVKVTHPEHPIEWLPADTILEVSRVRSITSYAD